MAMTLGKNLTNSLKKTKLTEMNCYFKLEAGSQGDFALGTLGGGNHFIEIGKDKDENFVMVVHTGSRRIGADVCEYYQNPIKTLSIVKANCLRTIFIT